MAPARRKRENQYFDVGKEGRKTGLTVAEQPKDQYGLESIEHVFSSPQKPASRPSRTSASLSSKEMELSRGSGVDPTAILSERRVLKSTKSHLAPPSSRSPRKTNLGSSPRRHSSIGPSARQSRASIGQPIRANGVRKLDFNQDLQSVQGNKVSPLRADLRRGARESASANIYELRESPDVNRSIDIYEHTEEEAEGAHGASALLDTAGELTYDNLEDVELAGVVNDGLDVRPERDADEEVAPLMDGAVASDEEENLDQGIEDPISSPMVQKKKRNQPTATQDLTGKTGSKAAGNQANAMGGAKRSNARQARSQEDDSLVSAPKPKLSKSTAKRTSSRRSTQSIQDGESDLIPISMPPPKVKPAAGTAKGRKRKAVEDDDAVASSSSSKQKKRSKSTNLSSTETSDGPSKLLAPSSRRPGPGQLTLLRQHTPAEELSTITRSGRRCVQPLQHWKLEKAERDWDGTITAVERVEEIQVQPRKQQRRAGQRSKKRSLETIEENDDDLEGWEAEGGSVIGPVQTYNPEDGTSSYDMHEEEIALGRLSITTKDVHGANFRYGKIVSMDFFGAGLIDLPVDGFKSKKQTRKMHMSFFVAEGKVSVTVGSTQFIISKGGTWQVPRGNSYSIENVGEQPAKLFFAQANEKFIAADDDATMAN